MKYFQQKKKPMGAMSLFSEKLFFYSMTIFFVRTFPSVVYFTM